MSATPPKAALPLAGKHFLLTRPREANEGPSTTDAFCAQLERWGGTVRHVPLVATAALAFACPALDGFDWLFFTSRNAVTAFFSALGPKPLPPSLKVAVVGPTTAETVHHWLGRLPDFIATTHQAASAAQEFAQRTPIPGLQVLWPNGDLAHPDLAAGLRAHQAEVTPLTVYQSLFHQAFTPEAWQHLRAASDMLIFTSPSTVQAYQALLAQGQLPLLTAKIACLGPKTAAEARHQWGQVDVEANPITLDSLAQAIAAYYRPEPEAS